MIKSELDFFFEEKRRDFPILNRKVKDNSLIYFDTAAMSLKPKIVIDSQVDFYSNFNSNIHRGIHTLSEEATEKFENVRKKVAKFINCDICEVIFTSGTTDSINLFASSFKNQLNEGDEIILSVSEHHSNLVVWQEIAKEKGLILKFINLKDDFTFDLIEFKDMISNKTKLVSIGYISNVTGTINDVEKIIEISHDFGALVFIDAAQAIAYKKLDMKKLDCDFLAFSAHKMLGPTGVGVLYGKLDLLENMNPTRMGGNMIDIVEFEKSNFAKIPFKFEAGTANVAGVIGFGVAIDYLNDIGLDKVESYELELIDYFLDKTKNIEGFKLFGSKIKSNRIGVFSFEIKNIHPHDVSAILDFEGIAIRAGHHCAMPLHTKIFKIPATNRVSLYFYNNKLEIDKLVIVLNNIYELYKKGNFLRV